MIIPPDKEIKAFVRSRLKAEGLSVAELERLSKFYGIGPYLKGKPRKDGSPRSIGVDNALAVITALENL